MILYKRTWNEYLIFVHAGDNPAAEPFATLWLRGNFFHRDMWGEVEKSLACLAIAELKRLQETEPLPNVGFQSYHRNGAFPEVAHEYLVNGWTELARAQSEDGN